MVCSGEEVLVFCGFWSCWRVLAWNEMAGVVSPANEGVSFLKSLVPQILTAFHVDQDPCAVLYP